MVLVAFFYQRAEMRIPINLIGGLASPSYRPKIVGFLLEEFSVNIYLLFERKILC